MAVGDVYRVAVEADIAGSDYIHVLYYETTVSVGDKASEMVGLGESVREDYIDSLAGEDLRSMTHSSVSFNQIKIRDISDPQIGLDFVDGLPLQGSRQGDRLSQQLCMLVLLKTAKIGRSFQGRNSLFVGTQDDLISGSFVQGLRSDVDVLMDSILVIGTAIGNPPGLHVFKRVVYSSLLSSSEDIIDTVNFGGPRTQRRRRAGVGS